MEKPLSINRRKNDRVDRSRDQTFSRRENDRRLYLYALYVTFSNERFDVNNPTRPLLRYRFSAVNRVDGKGSALLITLPRQCRKTCRCSFLPFNPAPAFPTNTNRVERIKHDLHFSSIDPFTLLATKNSRRHRIIYHDFFSFKRRNDPIPPWTNNYHYFRTYRTKPICRDQLITMRA